MSFRPYSRMFRMLVILASLTGADAVRAEDLCTPTASVTVTPEPRTNINRIHRHERLKKRFDEPADIVIIGDSIARRFKPDFYPPNFADKRVLNLGVGGDKTQNVLWRLNDLPLSNINPKTVLVILGTNNLRDKDAPCDIYSGIMAVVQRMKKVWAGADIIVTEIFPRGKNFAFRRDDRLTLNRLLSDGQQEGGYRFLTVDEAAFTAPDGNGVPDSYKPDLLHLEAPGYFRLSQALHEKMAE
jgi:platelet-activating factor acetylhydrolase IB subunit beta/gamma